MPVIFFSAETHPLTPSLYYRGGTIRLATSYLLSRIERRPIGEFRRSWDNIQLSVYIY
jgi:hypothetical protein